MDCRSQVISFNIGQAGCNMGAQIWDLISYESGLDHEGNRTFDGAKRTDGINISMLFSEKYEHGYTPRALFIDTEETNIDDLTTGTFKGLLLDEYMVAGKDSAGGCFARGKFFSGRQIFPKVCEALRRAIEDCTNPNAMCFYKSICGGTGSGFIVNLAQHVADKYPKLTCHSHDLIPSHHIQSGVTEPYNAVLSLASTIDLFDVRFIYDNETCYNLYAEAHKIQNINTTYYHVNHLVAQVISGVTGCSRWGSKLDCDLNQFQTNLVPFPHVNMISPSFVPINHSLSKSNYSPYSVTAMSFLNNHEMSTLDPTTGKYIACCMLYRGKMKVEEVFSAVRKVRKSFQIPFVGWVPTGFKIGVCNKVVSHPNRRGEGFKRPETALLKLTNHTGMFDVCNETIKKYNTMLEKRGYVFWYISEGMEEGEFVDAAEKLLEQQQKLKTTCATNGDGDDDDDDAGSDE